MIITGHLEAQGNGVYPLADLAGFGFRERGYVGLFPSLEYLLVENGEADWRKRRDATFHVVPMVVRAIVVPWKQSAQSEVKSAMVSYAALLQ